MSIDKAVQEGDFAGAVALLEKNVGSKREAGTLFMLFELKVLIEDYDGAERALDEVVALEPKVAPMMSEMRACLVSERERKARRAPHAKGPRRGLAPPQPFQMAAAKAAMVFANGDLAGATAALDQVRSLRPKVAGALVRHAPAPAVTVPFVDITDSDDMLGGTLEVVGPDGVVDVAFAELRSIVFDEVRGFQDTLWLPVLLETRDNRTLPARLFSLYAGSGLHAVPQVRLGQMTLWDHPGGIAIASGQRDFKLTDADGGHGLVGIRQITRIDFRAPAAPTKPRNGAGKPAQGQARHRDGPVPEAAAFNSQPAEGRSQILDPVTVAPRYTDAPHCLACDRTLSAEHGYWLYQERPRCDACAKVELRGVIGGPGRTLKIVGAAVVALAGYSGFIAMFLWLAASKELALGLVGCAFAALGFLNRVLDGDAYTPSLVERVERGRRISLYHLHRPRRWALRLLMLASLGAGAWVLATSPKPAVFDRGSSKPWSSTPTVGAPEPAPSRLRPENFEAAQRQLEADVEGRPPCFTGERRQLFVFTDETGKDVVVEGLNRVPSEKRAGARCIVE